SLRDSAHDDSDDEATEEDAPPDLPAIRHCFSLSGSGLRPLFVDRDTGTTADSEGEGRYRLVSHGDGMGPCPACSATNRSRDKLYPFRFGGPFIIGNASPILLSAMPPAEGTVPPPLPQ